MSMAMTWTETDLDTTEKRNKHTVAVVGCGRTGLSTACLFAGANFKVVCVDSNPYVVNMVKKGKIPSGDAKLIEQIKKHVKEGRVTTTNQAKEAAKKSDIIILAISPTFDLKKKPDYSNIENACKETGMGLNQGSIVLVENTIGTGITETLIKESLEKSSGLKAGTDFGLAYTTINTSLQPTLAEVLSHPKTVGALNEQSLKVAALVFKTVTGKKIVKVPNIKTVETMNLFQTIYLDVSNALASELALFCEKAGLNFAEIQKSLETQYSNHLPTPDPLTWFSSIDPYLLLDEAENMNSELHITAAARKINAEMLNHALRLTREALRPCGKTIRRASVSVLGVSNRPDVREINQPFVKQLVTALTKNGAKVRVYDPLFSQKQLAELEYPSEKTFRKSVEGADCLIFTVAHHRLKRLSLNRIKFLAKQPAAIVDLANAFNSDDAKKEGFVYRGLGKK